MALQKKEANLQEFLLQTQALFGTKALFRLGDQPLLCERAPTGIEGFDEIMGGGLPKGRLLELWGLPSAGKSMVSYQLMGNFERSLFIDAEKTLDEQMIRKYGGSEEKTIVMQPDYCEEAMYCICMALAHQAFGCVVLDSVPALIPSAVKQRVSSAKLKEFEKAPALASRAQILERTLPQVIDLADKSKSVVIFINQMRSKFGVMFPGQELYDTPGGNALHHYCSLRILFKRIGWIKDPQLGLIGQEIRAIVTKSKVCAPRKEAEILLLFEKGFVKHTELDDKINELRVEAGKRVKRGKKTEETIIREEEEEQQAMENAGLYEEETD